MSKRVVHFSESVKTGDPLSSATKNPKSARVERGRGRGLIEPVSFKCALLVFVVASVAWREISFLRPFRTLESSRSLDLPEPEGFPLHCTDEQLSTIQYQLPTELCTKKAKQPWAHGGLCSFSFATRCHQALWLEHIYHKRHEKRAQLSDPNNDDPFISFYIGCNKGMDAINTLRMGSGNASYDKDSWRNAFFAGHGRDEFVGGHCSQEFEPQFSLPKGTPPDARALVHCIEPLPANSKNLNATARKLGYDSKFKVHAIAMSNQEGTAYFPATSKLGDEQKSIGSCKPKKGEKSWCDEVPIYSLDTFLRDGLNNETSMIDLLSIDVEGYDALVLQGASKTLPSVKYLEFEYNWKGAWSRISLSSTVQNLKHAGFACYWAGSHGNIWRITDCWLDHYDKKFWSNVACVNVRDPSTRDLAQQMEKMFINTLHKGHAIRYDTLATEKTDGTGKAKSTMDV